MPEFFSDENNPIKSHFGSITIDSISKIISRFNEEDNSEIKRMSILKNINFLGFSLFKYRMIAKDQVRLVQRNGIPELAGYSGYYQRRIKIWTLWKPWTWFRVFRDHSSTVGIYKISDINNRGYIGYGDRHLVNVNPGDYAKAIIDGKPVLLDEGAHVIKTNSFSYMGKVPQSTHYIKHENLYRIQVPSAKIAAVIIDNEPRLLETGTYNIRSNNFNITQKILRDNSMSYFYDTGVSR